MSSISARAMIERLGLVPHAEGGWFAETWRSPAAPGERARSTVIHFLLETAQRSHWHKVDADEIWAWHGGDPLVLAIAVGDSGPVREVVLGPADQGYAVHAVVPAGQWQSAWPRVGPAGYALVSCVVAPAFDYAGFVLAPDEWTPGV